MPGLLLRKAALRAPGRKPALGGLRAMTDEEGGCACDTEGTTPLSRSRPCARALPVLGESPPLSCGES